MRSGNDGFCALAAFKAKHGHCNVPAKYPASPPLGRWLTRQRYSRHQGQLSGRFIQRLTELGVTWALKHSPGQRGRESLTKGKRRGTVQPPVASTRIALFCPPRAEPELRVVVGFGVLPR